MVWYDELYSSVRTSDVLKALDRLGGKGTLSQIEKQIIEIYKLPVSTIEPELIQEPLNILRKAGVIKPSRHGHGYIIKEKLRYHKSLYYFGGGENRVVRRTLQ